jgi:membrane protein implicated in regulation of membrane protease activity
MNWDDLTSIWRKQPQERVPEVQLEVLKNAFLKKSRRLARKLFWRDILELVGAGFVIFVFSSVAMQKGRAGWPLWIATALILGLAIFFLNERIRAKRNRTGTNAPLVQKIEADLAELRHQRKLRLAVGSWYLGPIFLSWYIVLASIGFHGLSGILRMPVQMGGYLVGGLFLFWLIWKLNRRAVRKCIEPRIADLERLRDDLICED